MLEVMIESMREFQRGFGRAARDGEVIEDGPLVASLAPSLGNHSLFNAMVGGGAGDLRAALPELERRYREAGVSAWGAWVHEADTEAEQVLEEHGLELDSSPVAMARELGDEPPAEGVELTDDLEAFDLVEASAWSFRLGLLTDGLPHALREFRCYLARDDGGNPAAIVGTQHHRGDCGVTLVGTVPEARGRGYATRAMRHALAEAVREGCRTTTLQASKAGYPIYARMGYRDFGTMHLWEKRAASAPS
jgi:GNAT superfamily N-acetyltransferase